MEDDRESVCKQTVKYFWEYNLICETCNRSYKNHDSEESCCAPVYYDKTFFPIRAHFYYNKNTTGILPNITWARISELLAYEAFDTSEWSTIMNSAKPQDAIQSGVKDSCLTAAIAVLSKNKNILKNIFSSHQNQLKGIYNVRLYSFGNWTNVLVDDYVPCDNSLRPLYARVYGTWAAIVEKAVAKFYGSYEALNGVTPVEFLNLLTGAPCTRIFIDDEFGLRIHPKTLWIRVRCAIDKNYLILAESARSTKKTNANAEFVDLGLLKTHPYCVLDVMRVCGKNIIKLLNTKGTAKYKGPWSYHYLDDKPDLQELLYHDCGEGEFWIGYDIFLEYFESLCVCQVRDDFEKISMTGSLHPLLLEKPTGVYFTIKRRTVVDMLLHQLHQRVSWQAHKRFLMDMFLIIFKKNDAGNYVYQMHSIRVVETILAVDMELDEGDYFVVPVTFNLYGKRFIDISNLRCLLEMFPPKTVFMDKKWHPFSRLRETLVAIAKEHGKTNHYESAVVYEYSNGFAGVAVVIENENHYRSLSVKSTYIGKPGKYESTRSAMTTEDIILPRHTQIIAVLTLRRGAHNDNEAFFRYQFDFLGEENAPQQPKHIPIIYYRTDHIHTPYLHNVKDQLTSDDAMLINE